MEELILKQVYLHAFVAYCYENGKTGPGDLITPLVKKVIATFNKKTFTPKEIHDEIIKGFSKDFPLILIEREFHKLSSIKVIEKNVEDISKNEYTLIQDLSDIIEHFMTSQNATNHFLFEFKCFLQKKNSQYGDLNLSALLKRLESFCMSNMIPIINYFGKMKTIIRKEKTEKEIDFLVEEFLNECVNRNNVLMSEFENIFNGINLLYLFENCSEEISKSDYSIKEKCFYLDTNILIMVLGFQSDYLNKLGEELYMFLVNNNFEIKIFQITLYELFSLIRGYDKASKYLVKGRNISSVYQFLKNQDYESFQIDDIIEMISNKLCELKIGIDNSTKWLPSDYKEFEDNINNLAEQKFEKRNDNNELKFDIYDENMQKYLYQAKHDMRCIELIRSLRKNIAKNRFEDEKYFFITADYLLLQFNKNISDNTKVKETIGDFTLCFLLYFHDPRNVKGIALNSFIAANYNNTNLSVANWIKYVQIIHRKYKNNEINVNQMGFLFTKTILTNNRFETEDMGDIINESLSEYAEMIMQHESLKTQMKEASFENEKLIKENEANVSEIFKKSEETGRLFEKIDDLENSQSDLKSEVSELRIQMKLIRRILFIIFTIIIGIAIGFFFYNKIVGSVLFIFGVLFDILNIIDKNVKFLIKE